jgi:hypothetical protein
MCRNLASLDVSGIMSLVFNFWPLFTLPNLDEVRISAKPEPHIVAPPQSVEWPHGLEGYRKSIIGQDIADLISDHGIQGFRATIAETTNSLGPLGRFFMRVAVLDTFGLSHFKGYDCDINGVLEGIPNSHSYEEVSASLKSIISQGLIAQVQSGGPTHLIDVKLSRGIPELAVIAPAILELRKKELEQVVLVFSKTEVNLQPLWETSYGFDMLSALCLGLSTNLQGIERIRTELVSEGIDLQITEDIDSEYSPSTISEELREYIIMHARQCGLKSE